MSEFFIRTEDIPPSDVMKYFAESAHDRLIVDALKDRQPTILVGSRGVGKSFLLRVAERELFAEFDEKKTLPVYISFTKSSLIQTEDKLQFQYWMLARIGGAIARALKKGGIITVRSESTKLLTGEDSLTDERSSKIEDIVAAYEESWRQPTKLIDVSLIPSADTLREVIEDLVDAKLLNRIVLLIDEAAHIFLPEQQRQFFTLFRDLRSFCLTCSAAVYPGVTSFGDVFQPTHDAKMLHVDRDITSPDYIRCMREIVEKQSDSSLTKNVAQNGKNFAILAYAASGNPRLLLKTFEKASKLSSAQVNEVVRDFYRSGIWSEHSQLSEKYKGHQRVIDWGRNFLEAVVLPEIKLKNDQYIAGDKDTSAYFWMHRDTPAAVREAIRVLSYTGMVGRHDYGIKASRGEIGTRYMVNLGCLFSFEATPTFQGFEIAKGLTPKRMTEFGSNHTSYKSLDADMDILISQGSLDLSEQFNKSVDVLDLSEWQTSVLKEIGLNTVGEVFQATEEKLKEGYYVGVKRARRMRNAAIAAVLEYLSG